MPKLKPGTILPTEEEDKAITKQAIADGTLHDDEELEQFRPFESSALPDSLKSAIRGRPKALVTKDSITIRLSPEVTQYFRSTGKGWQTRMDDVLREYVEQQSKVA
jgi:uncharacterized protein (DUF4415 family)